MELGASQDETLSNWSSDQFLQEPAVFSFSAGSFLYRRRG
jgi:hypothetical protein